MKDQGQLRNLLQMLMKMHVPISNECNIVPWSNLLKVYFERNHFIYLSSKVIWELRMSPRMYVFIWMMV
jgi:hypothetical protein